MGKRSRRRGEGPEAPEAGREPAADDDGGDAQPSAPTEPQRAGPKKGDLRLREAIDFIEEADMLLALYRWTVLNGEPPRPDDWLPREDWPHPDQVAHVFGPWNRFLEYSGIRGPPPLLRKRAQDERESRLEGRARQLDREE